MEKDNIQRFDDEGTPLPPYDGILNGITTVIFDLDGVVWTGKTVIDGASAALNHLKQIGIHVLYCTNNSSRTRKQHADLISKRLSVVVSEDDVLSSGHSAAMFLESKIPLNKRHCYVLGMKGLVTELESVGFSCISQENDPSVGITSPQELAELPPPVGVSAVVVGWDHNFSFGKMAYAMRCLEDESCIFVGTNRDNCFPMGLTYIPGAGGMISAVEVASGRQALDGGKPSEMMKQCLIRSFPTLDLSKTMMVGDRHMDVGFGNMCGMKTAFVLSGIGRITDDWVNELKPNYIIESISVFATKAARNSNDGEQ